VLAVTAEPSACSTASPPAGPGRAGAGWSGARCWPRPAWLVGSLGFSVYVNRVAHYDATYGPLGAVIAFMVWVWFSIMAVLVGAELNAEIEHQTAIDSTTGPEKPMGERGAAMADTVGLAFHPWEMIKREAGMVPTELPAKPPGS
jgi:membrane protein